MVQTLVLAANRGYALSSSRSGLIQTFLEHGWRVVIATADDDESRDLEAAGAILEPVEFNRGGLALGADFRAYRRLSSIYRYYQPALTHHFHAKPVILGSIAARRTLGGSVKIANTITGLGHAFVSGGIAANLAGLGYRAALPGADTTIFQNRDDQQLFLENSWVTSSNSKLIIGSGIDVDRFVSSPRPMTSETAPMIVMLGRLLNQKGVPEFIEVANQIRKQWPNARFIWAGEADEAHPDSVSTQWMRAQQAIEYVGRLDDVTDLLAKADLLLFPSSYREGVPRAVMEAAASGLPTVGFDVPGVREAVIDGQTGYLVPVKDSQTMAKRVAELLHDDEKRSQMGEAAQALAVDAFDRKAIEGQHIALYRDLGVPI
jgi:glycosyltransferase involved in cell wall biosynthesis